MSNRDFQPGAVPLSVVMPVYNEEDAIALACEEVSGHVLGHVPGSELVVVDDGSRDGTGRILDGVAASDPRIRVIHQANRGHGGALMAALAAARGDYVFLIDSDRQIPLDGFADAWALIERGHDGVFGVRRRRHDPALRLYLTRLIRFVVRALFGVASLDANVPYKLLRRSIWEESRVCIPPDTLAPSLFLAIFTRLGPYDIAEVDVIHRERESGVVSIRRLKLLKFCAKGFRQMMTFRQCVRRGR